MHPVGDVSSFGRVDEQSDPDYFIRFVDQANELPAVIQVEDMALAELRLRPGTSVNALIVESLAAEVERVRNDKDFTARAKRLLERDKELLDRLAR